MKIVNIVLILVALFCFISNLDAQERSVSIKRNTVFLGYPAYIFDIPDLGLYLGYNLEIERKDRFSWEGQGSVSYSKFERDSDNFAHDGGYTVVASVLFGPRLYLTKPEKNTRFYVNLLAGLSLVLDEEYQGYSNGGEYLAGSARLPFGYSVGGYWQFKNKFIVGAAYEQYASLVFKKGYKL